jgi:hypothetical protein
MYFLSPDPYTSHPEDTRSYNRYAYASYNPLTYTDPTGFRVVCNGVDVDTGEVVGTLPAPYAQSDVGDQPPCEITVCCGEAPPRTQRPAPAPVPLPELQFRYVDLSIPPPFPPTWLTPNGVSHRYAFHVFTTCSAADAFNAMKSAGMSAPDAPAATEGTTTGVALAGLWAPNPITQIVNPQTMTITNVTEQGHILFYGTVQISVTPTGSSSSIINVEGKGVNNYFPNDPVFNAFLAAANWVIGVGFFYNSAHGVEISCNARANMPYIPLSSIP